METTKTKAATKHPVIEIFGSTLQGEGLLIGQPVHFVRFGGCDYRCSWCDSKYAVDPREVKENAELLTDAEIVSRLEALPGKPRWIVFSGGNPALQHLDGLVDLLHEAGYKITIETQGTIFREWLLDCDAITVSPKPPSSGNETTMDVVDKFAVPFMGNLLSYKVVIFNYTDIVYLRKLVRHLKGRYPVFASVGNDVGLDSTEDLLDRLRWLAEVVLKDGELRGVRVLPQLHVLIWGNQRGV